MNTIIATIYKNNGLYSAEVVTLEGNLMGRKCNYKFRLQLESDIRSEYDFESEQQVAFVYDESAGYDALYG